jgi:hypothetical protein
MMSQEKKPEKERETEDGSRLSYEDRVLRRMLNTPPPKKRKQEEKKDEPG